MATSIQVFVQVALLFCVVTTSMGVIIDWQKEFSQLENKVTEQQEEIKSLYLIIQQLEKRLQILEMKGGIGGFMPFAGTILLFTVPYNRISCLPFFHSN